MVVLSNPESNISIHPALLLLHFLQLQVSFYWVCMRSDSLQRSFFSPFHVNGFVGLLGIPAEERVLMCFFLKHRKGGSDFSDYSVGNYSNYKPCITFSLDPTLWCDFWRPLWVGGARSLISHYGCMSINYIATRCWFFYLFIYFGDCRWRST